MTTTPLQDAEGDPHHWLGTESVNSRLGSFEFKGGYPTLEAARALDELLLMNRAIEVYLQNVSGVSMFKFRKGLRDFGVRTSRQVAIWPGLMDARTLLLTANSDTVYNITFLDLKADGPTVVELPPRMLGLFDDMWMRYISDGGLAGPDRGQGGKYLLVPPGYEGEIPASGYFVCRSPTYGVWMLMRAVDPDPSAAAERSRQMRIYPLGNATDAESTTFLEASGKYVDTIHADDYTFFDELDALVQEEPADAIDPLRRFYLASIGIIKGQPFSPDADRRALLAEAARVAAATTRMVAFARPDPEAPVYPDRRWQWAFVGGSYLFDSQGYENIDRRAAFAYSATGNTPAMASQAVGLGSQYMWTPRDAGGDFLQGDRCYRMRIPANPPVKDFWSVTVYDALSRSMIQTSQKFPAVSTYTKPEANDDGSVDIYFGPEAPAGKQANWIQTLPGRGWFPILRFYGPLQPFFDKSWRAGDIELEPRHK
ncbi:DUF1254 domain-containing protein [Stenotrophomonas sp. AB1(2024)]|uniref:DUF1254 domain-containing protein n=1 Tax=Stenotrophomonas sp. AB1(2024) TaxID=3132215 RepID=UPI0030A1FE29